ncbi:U1 small nuclear ribonucleoprotein 70 kDa [Lepeophtheirus salmonis]|uniref:U1 small nuclear ribonucleoprotein 70 kDa n=1 Tax=Lepeophtheirus salmonis TaxID=72036 RepID=UPI001AEA85FF|nr:U1 small nuclear ribonucleoprotein 70 kDa-like [Lepeophtheirus salmonis]
MTQFLPPNLLALFAPREPIPYLPPADKLPHEKKVTHNYEGIGAFMDGFENPEDTPAPTRVEMREERIERKKREKAEQVAYKLEQEIAVWDPHSVEKSTGDPYKTLFIGRINYYTSESKLRREFESYGVIKMIVLPKDSEDKPRGFAFIEYEHERDMHSAYKHADGKKIDGRRVLVDVERARTVKGWLPRRLGGGLGGTRRGGPEVNILHSGREDGGGARERGGRERRSKSRERRSRSRDRRRDRRRSRSRDRKRVRKSRSPSRRRSRSRDRTDRKRRRTRSKERKRERDRRGDRRGGGGGAGSGGAGPEEDFGNRVKTEWDESILVKQEPRDDYDEYHNEYSEVKQEPMDEMDRKPLLNEGYEEGQY